MKEYYVIENCFYPGYRLVLRQYKIQCMDSSVHTPNTYKLSINCSGPITNPKSSHAFAGEPGVLVSGR